MSGDYFFDTLIVAKALVLTQLYWEQSEDVVLLLQILPTRKGAMLANLFCLRLGPALPSLTPSYEVKNLGVGVLCSVPSAASL